jgi:hypothetical protein
MASARPESRQLTRAVKDVGVHVSTIRPDDGLDHLIDSDLKEDFGIGLKRLEDRSLERSGEVDDPLDTSLKRKLRDALQVFPKVNWR